MSNSNQSRLIKIRPIKVEQPVIDHSLSPEEAMEQRKASIESEADHLKAEIELLQQEKERLLEKTNAEIQEARQAWETEKANLIEEAKQAGYQAGFEKGREDGENSYRDKLSEANHIIDATTNDYNRTIENSEEAILELALTVANKIMHQQIEKDQESFIEIVKGAIDQIKDQSIITVLLHPANYDFVIQQKDELLRILGNEAKLSIYVDESLDEYACQIEHAFGKIDASIDTQLNQLRDALQDYVLETRQ